MTFEGFIKPSAGRQAVTRTNPRKYLALTILSRIHDIVLSNIYVQNHRRTGQEILGGAVVCLPDERRCRSRRRGVRGHPPPRKF